MCVMGVLLSGVAARPAQADGEAQDVDAASGAVGLLVLGIEASRERVAEGDFVAKLGRNDQL